MIPRRAGASRAGAALAPLLAYAALSVAFFSRAWFSSPTQLVDGSGDPQQSLWFLTWTPWAVGHGVNPFVTQHINAPDGVNLMWNASAPLLGLLLWPVTATAGAVVAYDLLVTAELALSAWCAFLLIRRYVHHRGAAFGGGLLYGFSPFLTTQAPSHAKVAFALLPPLLLLLIDDVVVRGRSARRGGLLLGVLLGLQLLVYEEGFVLALVAGAVVLAVLALRAGRARTRQRAGHIARALAWSLLPLALIAAVPVANQVLGPDRLPSLIPGGSVYVTDVANLVVPTPPQWLSPPFAEAVARRFTGNEVETASYLGIPLLAVMLYTSWRWRRRTVVAVTAACAVVLTILSLGPELHVAGHVSRLPLPWKVISVLPMFGSALPARLFVYVDLAAALLLAVFVDSVLLAARSAARTRLRVVAGGALALVAATLLPDLATAAPIPVPSFFAASVDAVVPSGATVLVAPYAHDGTTAMPMVWQASADMAFRMPEGYFVNVDAQGARRDGPPPTATSRVMTRIASGAALGAVDESSIRADLARWKVSAVLVGPMPHEDRMLALFTRVLHTTPVQRGGVYVWTDLPFSALAPTLRLA